MEIQIIKVLLYYPWIPIVPKFNSTSHKPCVDILLFGSDFYKEEK